MNTTGNNRKYPQIKFTQKKAFCIYALICPLKNKPIYIGCSSNTILRYYQHHSSGDNKNLFDYIQKTIKKKDIILKALYWTDNLNEAKNKESQFINRYKNKYTLFNKSFSAKYSIKKINNLLK